MHILTISIFRVRWELIQEEKKIMKELESGGANDALDTRLGEVCNYNNTHMSGCVDFYL